MIFSQKTEAEKHIKSFHEDISSSSERALKGLRGSADAVEITFPRIDSFLMEFIQNADDAESKSILFELNKNSITVYNDGNPFIDKDAESICSLGQTSKDHNDYMGYLGVGFKSIYLISDSPEICSGDYHFKFDKNECDLDAPYELLPIWLERPTKKLPKSYSTYFFIPFKESKASKRLKKSFSKREFNSRILLFLKSMDEIIVKDMIQGETTSFRRSESQKSKDYTLYKIEEIIDGKTVSSNDYLVFKGMAEVPEKILKDKQTQKERKSVTKRRVSVAFAISDGDLDESETGTIHMGVFSFVPLKEVESGLNFLVQGDFMTGAGRAEISRDRAWNYWMAHEMFELIKTKCIPIFLSHPSWRMNFTRILYCSSGGHEIIDKSIKRPLQKYLENNEVLIDIDGNARKPVASVKVSQELIDFCHDDDLKIMFPEKTPLHPQCTFHYSMEVEDRSRTIGFMTAYGSEPFSRLMEVKRKDKSVSWFMKLYTHLARKYDLTHFRKTEHYYNVEYNQFWQRVAAADIILTNRYTLGSSEFSYRNVHQETIPKDLLSEFSIVNPNLINNESFKEFIEAVTYNPPYGDPHNYLPILTKEDIKDKLNKKNLKELNANRWKNMAEDEKIESVLGLKTMYMSHDIDIEKLSDFVTLKAKDGQWYKPKKLLFSNDYYSGHSIERLLSEGLIDDLKLQFLAANYFEDVGGLYSSQPPPKEIDFFEKLGVETALGKERSGKLSEEIAIKMSLKYEEDNGREAKELPQRKKEIADIISQDSDHKRFIEVKGESTNTGVALTSRQTINFMSSSEKYYLYVVTETLTNPTLRVVSGKKLVHELNAFLLKITNEQLMNEENLEDKLELWG